MLKINDKVPEFELPDKDGKMRKLSDYLKDGKYVLLYFYPKDNTSGCTKEALELAEHYEEFTKLNTVVIGVSKDDQASHAKFVAKYNLPFVLLSDRSTKVIDKYGAWQEKSMYGKKYMGTARISYLIEPSGKIIKVYPKVKPDIHAKEVLEDLRTIQHEQ